MSDPARPVALSVDEATAAARDLEEFVVSLDRILSRIGTGGHDPAILVRYVSDRRVLPRLAELRRIVQGALEEVIGEEAVDDIAETAFRYSDP